MPDDGVRRNDMIRAREVRVIGAEGEQLGILQRSEAIAMAQEVGCDLVEVSSNSEPPVCRIMDYGKFKYEQQKKKQDAKKRQAVVQVKEIKVRPKTDEHDYETKVKHIRRFLEDGDRCKVTVFFRGREIVHKDRGLDILERIVKDLEEGAKVDQEPRAEGRTRQMLLVPKKELASGCQIVQSLLSRLSRRVWRDSSILKENHHAEDQNPAFRREALRDDRKRQVPSPPPEPSPHPDEEGSGSQDAPRPGHPGRLRQHEGGAPSASQRLVAVLLPVISGKAAGQEPPATILPANRLAF